VQCYAPDSKISLHFDWCERTGMVLLGRLTALLADSS